MRIGLATCLQLPEPDPDEAMTVWAFQKAGCEVELAAWDDPAVDWRVYDLVLFRSTWNYPTRVSDFREWIERVSRATSLRNQPHVALWNLDKHYLADLESDGVPVVPTLYTSDFGSAPWDRFVVKPTISCGSYLTKTFARGERNAASSFMARLLRSHEPMVQPYLSSVESEGERSLVWIDGEFTHAIRKAVRFADDEESVSAAYEPSSEEFDVSRRAIEAAPNPLLYARVDLMMDMEGHWVVSELELLEPSLFFLQCPSALGRFVTATIDSAQRR